MMNPKNRRVKRLVTAIVADLLVLGALLGAFTYFYFLRERDYSPRTLTSPTPAVSAAPEATAAETSTAPTEEAAATPTPAVADTGLLGGKYAEKFTTGEVEQTDTSYKSANVSIDVQQIVAGTAEKPITYYLADIYIKDISSFRTAVALDYKDQNQGDRKNVMSTKQLSQLTGALLAISGDNFAYHQSIAVRNGVEWENKLPVFGDICVLYYDGTKIGRAHV
jgi:hypothetical protein